MEREFVRTPILIDENLEDVFCILENESQALQN